MKKVLIYWETRNYSLIRAIRDKFHLPQYMTVNGETEAVVSEEVLEHLKKGASMTYKENGVDTKYLTLRKIEDYGT